jgi:pimeloyl-ACP methyl ester carboxylesterase
LARLLIAVVVVLALLLLGGGWYFAGQINADGLQVDPSHVGRDLTVTAVTGTSITLRERGSRVDGLHTPGVYGVQWATGFGQVSGGAGKGREVRRSFTVLTGTPPSVGDTAGLTQDAFPDAPSVALGVPVREVVFASSAGSFPAWWVPGRSTTWVVLVHGKGASRTEMLRMMRVPVRLGLPSLDITYRNDDRLPLDKSQRYQYGRTEWHDLEAAVSWAQQHGAQHVVLVGASMGGAIVAAFMEHSSRASLVSGLFLDSPLLSFERAVDLGASERDLPLLGWPLPGPLTWTAERIAALRYGIDWKALDYLDDTRWVRVPTLLVHGTGDGTVPVAGSIALAHKRPSLVTFDRVSGVDHVEAWNHDPTGYEDQERHFLERVR